MHYRAVFAGDNEELCFVTFDSLKTIQLQQQVNEDGDNLVRAKRQ